MTHRYADVEAARQVLPAWFVERMMTDQWGFGLLLTTGIVLVIERIEAVSVAPDKSVWLDVQVAKRPIGRRSYPIEYERVGPPIGAPYDDRTMMTVNAAHVVMAFETWSS